MISLVNHVFLIFSPTVQFFSKGYLVKMIHEFTIEELKTSIGCLTADLRGNWGYDYVERIEQVKCLLEEFLNRDETKIHVDVERYKHDLEITNEELATPEDGRAFRSHCLYSYHSKEGMTERVKIYIEEYLTHPEYNSFGLETLKVHRLIICVE